MALVKHFESLFLKAYKDPVGIWTIGWGNTGREHNDGTVHEGLRITEEQAEAFLRHDMNSFEARVAKFVKVELTPDQFSALVSFDFNCGALPRSTLLKKLNAKDYEQTAKEFLRWNRAGGRVFRGLTRRRQSERNLFEEKADYLVTEISALRATAPRNAAKDVPEQYRE